jgi:hypothetical protein
LGRLLNAGLLSQARELADIFNHNSADLTIVLVSRASKNGRGYMYQTTCMRVLYTLISLINH